MRNSLQPPPSSITMCANDARVDLDVLKLVHAYKENRNNLFVLECSGAQGRDEKVRYFVKERASEHSPELWRVERDYVGMLHVLKNGPKDDLFGSIFPVGFEKAPRRYLATRFQAGTTMDHVLNRAVSKGEEIDRALRYSQLLGSWLARFRQSARGDPADRSLETLAEEVRVSFARLRGLDVPRLNRALQVLESAVQHAAASSMAGRPSHGDMGAQNFIFGRDGKIYPIDFSSFSFRWMNYDVASYRNRLEKAMLFGSMSSRRRAHALWKEFWEAYLLSGESPLVPIFSYLHKLSRFKVRPQGAGWVTAGPRIIGRGLRDVLWLNQRRRWLASLPDDGEKMIAYFASKL